MANPLILSARPSERIVQLGREKRRRDRRKDADVIITEAIKILGVHLPRMLKEPPHADDFEKMWPIIDAQLIQVLKTRDAYLMAYSFLSRKIEQGNREGIWQIDPPAQYLTVRRNYPFRTESWHKATIAMTNSITDWKMRLTSLTDDADTLFARLLISGIINGGLNRPALWVALGKTLQHVTPLQGNEQLTWLTLTLEPGDLPSNKYVKPTPSSDTADISADKVSTTQAVTEVQYVPDPISLGILHRFLKCRQNNWRPPSSLTACKSLLEEELGRQHSLKSLCRGAIGFTEHIAGVTLPQVLLEYAVGRTKSASLPLEYWHRLLNPQLLPSRQNSYASFMVRDSSTPEQRANTLTSKSPFLLDELRTVFRKDPATPKGMSEIILELHKILQYRVQTLSEQLLVTWLLSLLEERQRASSTASRYLESVGKVWLSVTLNLPLNSYTSEDYADLYESMLNRPCSQNTRDYMAGRFQDMHTFAVQRFDLPSLDEPLTSTAKSTPHVQAAIVDETLFTGLLAQIDCFIDADHAFRVMIKCMLIIAYRTGLRPGEIAKLRIMDVEPSSIGWLFIRNNRHGHNKTDAGLRKVPLYPLLTAAERELVRRYLGDRRMTATDYELIFHAPGNPHEILNMKQLSQMVRTVLGQLSGGLPYRLYDLRHSCFSRMQLLLHADLVQLPNFIQRAMLPYSDEEKAEILRIVTGENRLRDRYMALAVMAGHSSPEITLNSYLHFTDLSLGLHLSSNQTVLSKQESGFLFGLSTCKNRQLENADEPKTTLTPEKLRPFLATKLKKYTTNPIRKQRQHTQAKTLADVDRASHFEQSEAALKLLEKGHEPRNIASQFGLSECQIETWQANAIALRNLKTSKGASRLFPRTRQHNLLPAELNTTIEKHALIDGLRICQSMRRKRKQMHEFRWFIQYCLTHVNSSHGGIQFTEPKIFRRFMKMANRIFPKSQWYLDLHVPADKPSKRWYVESALTIKRCPLRKINQFPQGYGNLRLQHPKEELPSQDYSSPLLRYICHRFAIILFNASNIQWWEREASQAELFRQIIESRDKLLETTVDGSV
ncbi:MAG: tyrosine-type recombinase/integrase [Shewanella indica]|uniref:tyrosine-type recombinase/integrase n=1 Tax=Shewanella indica TaxID=768528 RepID=UPI003C708E65